MSVALSGDESAQTCAAARPASLSSRPGGAEQHSRSPAFWDLLEVHGRRIALLSARGEQVSYQNLANRADRFATTLPTGRKLLVQVTALDAIDGIAAYLGALRAGHAVLADPAAASATGQVSATQCYRPDVVIGASPDGPETGSASKFIEADGADLHPDLALVMSTSGSTGDPKAVRLSRDNVAANARQIVSSVDIDAEDRAMSSLPGHFIYGLSVLNSHLAAGASYVLSDKSVFDKAFWREADALSVNSFAGVPYTFRALRRLGLERAPVTIFRKVCHSGGFLDDETFAWFSDRFAPPGAAVYFMYGQTEAAGRIAVLPPALASTRRGAVGAAVPGGRLAIAPDGEVIFTGPNVMMGYATCRADLALGDECHGVLHTGDLGEMDADGILRITGRLARFAKVMGKRISLDALENHWQAEGDLAVVGDDERITVFVEGRIGCALTDRIAASVQAIGLPPGTVHIRLIDHIPRASSGKIDRSRLDAGPQP